MFTKVVIGLVVCNLIQESYTQLAGSKCNIPNSNQLGECKLLKNCSNTIEDIRINSKSSHSQCKPIGPDPIVCCPLHQKRKRRSTEEENTRIHIQKCMEYSKSVYEENHAAGNVSPVETCGVNDAPLIGDDDLARSREFPHFALLGYNATFSINNYVFVWLGGGSLISTHYVLTAAHLLSPRHYGPVQRVRLGDFNNDQSVTTMLVGQLIPHPDFNPPKNYYNDIGLIKLVDKIHFSQFIRPICLPASDKMTSNQLIESGWEHNEKYETGAHKLHRYVVDVITNEDCNSHYIYNISRLQHQNLSDKQMCTTFNKDRNFCRGDTLQIVHPDIYCMYVQIGVVSFGHECIPGLPNLYTRVHPYLDWIEDIVWSKK